MSKVYCKSACFGKDCKYEKYEGWIDTKNTHIGIRGLYSNWINDTILATARPSTRLIKQHDIIKQFQESKIGAIINLQQHGEHAYCGDGNDSNGFSYSAEEFMNNGIFFYNFGWEDLTIPSLDLALNIAHVIDSTAKQGKRVAIHCHAGLGRTGTVIVNYLNLYEDMTYEKAVEHVRQRRPGSVQNARQLDFCRQFQEHVNGLRVIFHSKIKSQSRSATSADNITIDSELNRQRKLLHGEELDRLRFVPRIVQEVCERLLQLKEDNRIWGNIEDKSTPTPRQMNLSDYQKKKTEELKEQINRGKWNVIRIEIDSFTLLQVLQDWIQQLSSPIITQDLVQAIQRHLEENLTTEFPFDDLLENNQAKTLHTIISCFKKIHSSKPDFIFNTMIALCMGLSIDQQNSNNGSTSAMQISNFLFLNVDSWTPALKPKLLKQVVHSK